MQRARARRADRVARDGLRDPHPARHAPRDRAGAGDREDLRAMPLRRCRVTPVSRTVAPGAFSCLGCELQRLGTRRFRRAGKVLRHDADAQRFHRGATALARSCRSWPTVPCASPRRPLRSARRYRASRKNSSPDRRQQAEGGLDLGDAAKRGRPHHRAAGLRADGERDHAGRDGRGRARGGSARGCPLSRGLCVGVGR